MIVPRKARRKQAGTTEPIIPPLPVPSMVIIRLLGPNDPDPGTAEPPGMTLVPDNGTAEDSFPDDGPRCPTCGTPRPPFNVRLSGLLDLATIAHEATGTLKSALEQEVLP